MLSLLIGCALLPSGTTSNEALHYETNRCFKETQELHLTSLQQKLDILQLGKLLSHNRAFCHHTTKQVQHGVTGKCFHGQLDSQYGIRVTGVRGVQSCSMVRVRRQKEFLLLDSRMLVGLTGLLSR